MTKGSLLSLAQLGLTVKREREDKEREIEEEKGKVARTMFEKERSYDLAGILTEYNDKVADHLRVSALYLTKNRLWKMRDLDALNLLQLLLLKLLRDTLL